DVAAAAPVFVLRAHWLQPRLMEHPLDGAVKQHSMIETGNLAVEPEMDAGDGRIFEVRDLFSERCALGRLRKRRLECVERKRDDQIVERFFRLFGSTNADAHLRRISSEGFDGATKTKNTLAGTNIIARGVVKVGERKGRHSHVTCGRSLHRFAYDLGGGGN